MNLNSISKMSEEELDTVIQIAKMELANRYHRLEIGLNVKIHAPSSALEVENDWLRNRTGRIYGIITENDTTFFEVVMDNVIGNGALWDFEAHEISPAGTEINPCVGTCYPTEN